MFYFYGSFPFDMGSAGASHPPYIRERTKQNYLLFAFLFYSAFTERHQPPR